MLAYTARRVLFALPLLLGLSIVVFVYIRLVPGDPVAAMLGVSGNPELVERLTAKYGFDKSLPEQYVLWAGQLLQGDLGVSFRSQQPIGPLILGRVSATFELMLGGFVIATALGLPAGIWAGMKQNTRVDRMVSFITLVGLGTPAFVVATVLVSVFSLALNTLPSQGYTNFERDPIGNLTFLILPAFTLGISSAPYLARVTRASVIEIMKEPFVPFADAKGLHERTIFLGYVLRNVLPTLSVILGLMVGFMLAGSIIVETFFNWPGMGRVFVGSIIERDYALVQALILIYGALFLLINLGAELVQGLLDPRVRLR